MKKLFALILCLSMTFGAVALAAEKELNKNVLQGTTNVSMTIDHNANSFVVVIPADVTIDPETKNGTLDIVLKSGWNLVSSNSLKVRLLSFANGASNDVAYDMFSLKNENGDAAAYRILAKSDKESSISENPLTSKSFTGSGRKYWAEYDLISVLKTSSNANDHTASLKLEVPALPTEPGEYTDTITFAIILE